MITRILGCHILQHFNFSLLPKHFLVQFDERILKMPRKSNLVDALVSLWPWKVIVLGAYTSHIKIPSEANFIHLNEAVGGFSHHKTNQHIYFDPFGHKNHEIWSIWAEIMAYFHI